VRHSNHVTIWDRTTPLLLFAAAEAAADAEASKLLPLIALTRAIPPALPLAVPAMETASTVYKLLLQAPVLKALTPVFAVMVAAIFKAVVLTTQLLPLVTADMDSAASPVFKDLPLAMATVRTASKLPLVASTREFYKALPTASTGLLLVTEEDPAPPPITTAARLEAAPVFLTAPVLKALVVTATRFSRLLPRRQRRRLPPV
jgi:hypothetical protein